MDVLLDRLQHDDFFPTLLVAGLLFFIGSKVSEGNQFNLLWSRRSGYAAFVAYAVLGVLHFHPSEAGAFFLIFIRGVLVAGMVFGAAGIVLPMIRGIYRLLIGGPLDRLAAARRAMSRRFQERRERIRQKRSNAEWERSRPEREREAKLAADRKTTEERMRDEAKERRKEARSQCELHFNLYEADIKDRFNRKMLHDYMDKYMGDSETAETVERRGIELRAQMERHREAVGLGDRPKSIDQLARWYLEERGRIEALPLDEGLARSISLNWKSVTRISRRKILEKARP